MYDKRKAIFNKIVNPLILKHMIDPHTYTGSCIASGIPIKYLKYFKEVTKHKNAMNVRYRYRGNSGVKTNYLGKEVVYDRPQSFCHMAGADTFAIYTR